MRAIARMSCNPVSASAEPMPRIVPAKYGSSKTRNWDSDTTSATVSVRRVTKARAARLGT
ncbi:hypothetical protein GCM10020001_086120 [Nonomuraea salmonea]